MKESNLIFIPTFSGDRTNIMAGFQLLSKEQFLKGIKDSKLSGRIRYGKVGGWVSLLKEMHLDEFEENFSPEEFTKEEITELFRKDISMKYGIHGEKAKIKPLTKKELEPGFIYTDFTGNDYLYLGEVERVVDATYLKTYQSGKKPITIEKGLGFIWWYNNKEVKANNVYVLKGIKKFIKRADFPQIKLEQEYAYESGKMTYSSNECKITVKINLQE